MDAREPLKMVLIGDTDIKNKFTGSYGRSFTGNRFGFDIQTIVHNSINFLICNIDDNTVNYSNELILTLIQNFEVIILFNADPDRIKQIEDIKRNSHVKYIIIDFNSMNLPPLMCLDNITPLLKYVEKEYLTKSAYIYNANKLNTESCIYHFPDNIISNILEQYTRISNGKIFYSLPNEDIKHAQIFIQYFLDIQKPAALSTPNNQILKNIKNYLSDKDIFKFLLNDENIKSNIRVMSELFPLIDLISNIKMFDKTDNFLEAGKIALNQIINK